MAFYSKHGQKYVITWFKILVGVRSTFLFSILQTVSMSLVVLCVIKVRRLLMEVRL